MTSIQHSDFKTAKQLALYGLSRLYLGAHICKCVHTHINTHIDTQMHTHTYKHACNSNCERDFEKSGEGCVIGYMVEGKGREKLFVFNL